MEWGWLAERQVTELQRENRRRDIKTRLRRFLQGISGVPGDAHLIAISLKQQRYYTGIAKREAQGLSQRGAVVCIGLFAADGPTPAYWAMVTLPALEEDPTGAGFARAMAERLGAQVDEDGPRTRYLLTFPQAPQGEGWRTA